MNSRLLILITTLSLLVLTVGCQAPAGELPPLPAEMIDDPAVDVADLPPPVPAGDVKFDQLSLEQGLSQSTVTAILQDNQGFMWFGTLDGLNRYDGYAFDVFKHDSTDTTTLSDNAVSTLLESSDGTLWIGTDGGGLNRYDPDTETFVRFRNDPENPASINSDTIRAIVEGDNGDLWIGTQNGVNRLDHQSLTFAHFPNQISSVDNFKTNDVNDLYFDPSGNLWVATAGGLLSFDPANLAIRFYPFIPARPPVTPEEPEPVAINSIVSGDTGQLWLGTVANGLFSFDPAVGRAIRFQNDPEDPTSLSNNSVYAVSIDERGNVWVGTQHGLNVKRPDSNDFTRFQHDPTLQDSLADNDIRSLYLDEAGVLWIGTRIAGLDKLDPYKTKFQHIRATGNPATSLSHPQVLALLEDERGYLWIGTGAGLNRWDRDTGLMNHYFHDTEDDLSLSNDQVTSITQDSSSVLWIGTRGGLNRFNRAGGNFSRFQADPQDPRGLSSDLINTLFEDKSGYLWVGTAGAGLDRRDPTNGRFDHFSYVEGDRPPETLGLNHILSFYETSEATFGGANGGILWIGTMGGLIKFDQASEEHSYYRHDPADGGSLGHDQVNDIYLDSSGTLWLATGGGLDRYELTTDSFSHITEEDGLPSNMVLGIMEDGAGNLWISHNAGLTRYDPEQNVVRNYDTSDGLQSLEFNQGARITGQQGEMFFGGVNGFNLFDPADIHDNPYQPPVVITDLQIFNESVPFGDDSMLNEPIYRTDAVELSGQDKVITFELAALHYGAPDEIQYAYLMEGFDKAWNYLGNRRYATYTNLPPGNYTFHAVGSNSDGVWNEEGVAVAVTIPRPFWQSLWFVGLVMSVIVAAIFGGYRLRSRSTEARTRELEEQVAHRTIEIERRRQIAEGLREILVLLNTKRSLEESLHYIVTQAARLTDAEDAIIFRLDKDREMSIVATNPGGQIRYQPDAELLAIVEDWPAEEVSEREPLIVPSLVDYWTAHGTTRSWAMTSHHALLGVQLQFDDQDQGGLFMFYTAERDFSEDDLELGRTFGDQATLAIANDRLRRQAEQTAIASERSRLARELHDAVTQTIFSASLLTETLEPIWEMDRDEGRKLLAELRQLTRGALAEMRTLLLELRPSALEDSKLSGLLRQLAEAVTGRTGIPVTAHLDETGDLPVNVRIALYRIAQESLNNVVKHARASEVSLTLRAGLDGNGAILTVRDNGRGFELQQVPAGRLGLGIIRERAAAIGAELSITSDFGQGTTVNVVWSGGDEVDAVASGAMIQTVSSDQDSDA